MADQAQWLWFNGEIVPRERATVHVTSATATRGANVFEGIRAYWNGDERELYIFRNDEHLARLRESAKIMRMPIPWSPEELTRAQIDVLHANKYEATAWYRLCLYVGEGEQTSYPPADPPIGGYISTRLAPHTKGVTDGVDSGVSSWQRISDTSMPPRIKAGANYHNSRLAAMEAKNHGYSGPPIMMNERGKVSEGPGACLCMVRRGTLVTAPVTSNILESITRETLMELARDVLKVSVQEREIDRTELYVAEEVFFCGSGAEITPVNTVDHYPVGAGKPGPMTRRLQETYFSVAEGRVPQYRHWLTPVYAEAKVTARS